MGGWNKSLGILKIKLQLSYWRLSERKKRSCNSITDVILINNSDKNKCLGDGMVLLLYSPQVMLSNWLTENLHITPIQIMLFSQHIIKGVCCSVCVWGGGI